MLGRSLAAQARRQGRDVLALTSAEWDITDPAAAERFIQSGDVVINCAAYTKVDAAEDDQERAHAVNAVGPENVAQACARVGADLIHISTDYVFSGAQHRPYEIDDETGPLGVYGRTKLAGELTVLAAMPDAHIVRTAWVYEGADGGDFVAVMRRLAAGDGPVEVVADQVGSPTYVGDLAGALLQIADDGSIREPVLHAANEGAVSRFDAGPSGVRDRRRRSGPRAPRRHRPPSPPRAAAGLFGLVRTAIHRGGPDAASTVARGAGGRARHGWPATLYAVSQGLVSAGE